MYVGIVGCYHRSVPTMIAEEYNRLSDFNAIKSDGLKRLCELKSSYEDTSNNVIDILYDGLTKREITDINACANTICNDYTKELAVKAVDKMNYKDSQIFKTESIEDETEESIDKLKDTFSISKIRLSSTKKVLNYYSFDIVMKSNAITFNGASYTMQLKVLAKNDPFDVKVMQVNFIVDKKKEGE